MRSNFTQIRKRSFPLQRMAIFLLFFAVCAIHKLNAQSTTPSPYQGANHGCNNNGQPCQSPMAQFSNVSLGTMVHSAPCPSTRREYSYWNNVAGTTITQGSINTINITGTSANNYPISAGVWIDYDRNGQFSNAEFVGNIPLTPGVARLYDFSVPCSAVAGASRMRVRTDIYSTWTAGYYTNAPYCYGETWDFDITIGASTTPSASYTQPDTVYTNSPALFVNNNQTGYTSHSWDVVGQGSNVDGNGVDFQYSFPAAGTYQLKLTSTNCLGTAITTRNVVVRNPTSAPRVNFVTSGNVFYYDANNPTAIFVDFFDLSAGGPTTWEWSLAPGGAFQTKWDVLGSLQDQNMTGFFYDNEVYDVCLIASNSAGYDTLCKRGYVQVLPPAAGGSGSFENLISEGGSPSDSGMIYDTGGPNNGYRDGEKFQFLINPCGADAISITFSQFGTESCCDYLRVYDGDNTGAPLLGEFRGAGVPPTLTANSGVMLLDWYSDGSQTDVGFAARWDVRRAVPLGAPDADFAIPDTLFMCGASGATLDFVNTTIGVTPGQANNFGTWKWIFEFDPTVTYPSGYTDDYAQNPTYTYSAAGTYQIRLGVNTCQGNDTVVKSVVVATTNARPTVDFTTNDRILKVGGTAQITSMTKGGCSYKWTIFPTTFTYQGGTSATTKNANVKFSAPGSYNITLEVTNANGVTTKVRTNYIDVIQYCTPNVTLPIVAGVGITNVKIENINRTSPSGVAPGYSDYSANSVDLIPGKTYSISVSRSANVDPADVKVWIDYNRDGDFNDVNELAIHEAASRALVFTGTFTVPSVANVVLGETKIRIGTALGGSSNTPCGPNYVGEFEDYTGVLKRDNVAPVITLIGGDTTIEKNTSWIDPGAIAFDNIEGNITNRIIASSTVDTAQAGIYIVTYVVTDQSGLSSAIVRRTVNVAEDLTAPTIILNAGSPYIHSVKTPFVDPRAVATDLPSGNNISSFIVVTGTVNENVLGDYDLTYTITDAYGNKSSVIRTVQVRDITAPTIVANATYEVQVGLPFTDPVTISDNYYTGLSPIVVSGSVNSNIIGDYDVVYAAIDGSGNAAANKTVTYKVEDYIAPVFTTETILTAVVYAEINDVNFVMPAAKADDNYYNAVQITNVQTPAFDISTLGVYTITYTATDRSGNSTVWVRTVHVVDTKAPIVIAPPLNVIRWSVADLKQGVTVNDGTGAYAPADFLNATNGCTLTMVSSNVDANYPGVYEAVFVAVDGSGNRSQPTARTVYVTPEGASGINDASLENAIKVYPNPSTGNVKVEITVAISETMNFTITNIVGETVKVLNSADFNNGVASIDLSNVASGIYFLQVTNNNKVATKKIVINK